MTNTRARFATSIGHGGFTALLLVTCLSACGSNVGPADVGSDPTSDPTTGKLSEAFGESSCMWTAPDVNCGTVDVSNGCAAYSVTATYDHSSCTNSWIAQGNIITTSRNGTIYGFYDGSRAPIADGKTWPCNAMWSHTIVYQWHSFLSGGGGSWTQIVDDKEYGFLRNGECVIPESVTSATAGTYKVVVQAGFITVYEPAGIIMLDG